MQNDHWWDSECQRLSTLALWDKSYWQKLKLFPNLPIFVLRGSFSTKSHSMKIAAPSALGLLLLDVDY